MLKILKNRNKMEISKIVGNKIEIDKIVENKTEISTLA